MSATRGQIVQRHKKELREFKKSTETAYHGVPKKDKEKRREIGQRLQDEEKELFTKQERELEAFDRGDESLLPAKEEPPQKVEEEMGGLSLYGNQSSVPSKQSKASKRRNKKQQQKIEAIKEKAAEIERCRDEKTMKQIEMEQLLQVLSPLSLQIHMVPGNGHCLYSSVIHQLSLSSSPLFTEMWELRKETASYLSSHQDFFAPFIDGDFEEYCEEVATSAAWGGHVELQVLPNIIKRAITVYSADSPPLEFGKDLFGEESPPILLSYHKHFIELGEHYNSVVEIEK